MVKQIKVRTSTSGYDEIMMPNCPFIMVTNHKTRQNVWGNCFQVLDNRKYNTMVPTGKLNRWAHNCAGSLLGDNFCMVTSKPTIALLGWEVRDKTLGKPEICGQDTKKGSIRRLCSRTFWVLGPELRTH